MVRFNSACSPPSAPGSPPASRGGFPGHIWGPQISHQLQERQQSRAGALRATNGSCPPASSVLRAHLLLDPPPAPPPEQQDAPPLAGFTRGPLPTRTCCGSSAPVPSWWQVTDLAGLRGWIPHFTAGKTEIKQTESDLPTVTQLISGEAPRPGPSELCALCSRIAIHSSFRWSNWVPE